MGYEIGQLFPFASSAALLVGLEIGRAIVPAARRRPILHHIAQIVRMMMVVRHYVVYSPPAYCIVRLGRGPIPHHPRQ